MGACDFQTIGHGKTYREAFNAAVREAHYMHGHGGYTGSIAEKPGAILTAPPEGMTVKDYIERLWDGSADDVPASHMQTFERDAAQLTDKWGDCLAFDLGEGRFLFTGLASE